jgi:hypothetical protein
MPPEGSDLGSSSVCT